MSNLLCIVCRQPSSKKYCSRTCYFKRSPTPISERIWQYVNKTDGCWLWTASVDRKGYGKITVRTGEKTKWVIAHRAVYELLVGPIPEGMHLLHHCDNPLCVNPSHMFIGTNDDNIRDMIAKGRNNKGEDQHCAKLTESQVIEIRRKLASVDQKTLANEYGVTVGCIRAIRIRKSWKHLDEEGQNYKGDFQKDRAIIQQDLNQPIQDSWRVDHL